MIERNTLNYKQFDVCNAKKNYITIRIMVCNIICTVRNNYIFAKSMIPKK